MPAQRRHEIARTATTCGVKIIEDDPYWLLADDAPPPVARFAPEQVTYISTLSKCLSPGLRTAFVLLPDAQSRERFLVGLRAFALMTTPLTTALATQWIHDGSAIQLLAGVQAEARARQELTRQILESTLHFSGGGVHVWLALPSYWTSQELARTARAEGLAVTSSDAFYIGPKPPNAIRISLGGIRDRTRLAAALRKLSLLLTRKPSVHRDIVI
jgi:DNA-binding transcriptional MocR family regulator